MRIPGWLSKLSMDARHLFKWKYWPVTVPTFVGLAVTLLFQNKYVLAYIFWAITLTWCIASWLSSDEVSAREPKPARKSASAQSVEAHQKKVVEFTRWKYQLILFFLVVFGAACWYTHSLQVEDELKQFIGKLIPDNESAPPNPCGSVAPKDAVTLMFGNNAAFSTHFPHTVLMVGESPVITLDRDGSGSVYVGMEVRSKDNRIIVRLDRDGFIINQNNYLRKNRAARSTLSVTDQEGHTLSIRYINRKTISVDGEINIPGRGILSLQLRGLDYSCAGGDGRSDIHIL